MDAICIFTPLLYLPLHRYAMVGRSGVGCRVGVSVTDGIYSCYDAVSQEWQGGES